MLEGVHIRFAVCQGLVGQSPVGERLPFDVDAVFFGYFSDDIVDWREFAGAYRDIFEDRLQLPEMLGCSR